MITARRLNTGDKIAIVSPSDPIEDPARDANYQAGLTFLKDQGLQIAENLNLSPGSPQGKAEDLLRHFSDPGVAAIIASQGGNSAEEVLPFLDWELIKANPKIFLGISDITVLLNAILQKTGLVTFHGNDIKWGFGRNITAYDKEEFVFRLIEGRLGQVRSNGKRRCVRRGTARGTLLGGNLRCLLKLKDTDCWPDFRNSVLMLEAFRLTPDDSRNLLQQLKDKNVFDQVRGVIVGYIYEMQALNPDLPQLEDILLDFTKEYDFPILKVNDFGHNCPNTVLPIGGQVELDADNCSISLKSALVA